jgi:hypothetical protein
LTAQRASARVAARARTRHPTEVPVPDVGDTAISLAYDAGLSALRQQDTTLSNLRNRATGLFSTAALVTSFGGGLGLINANMADGAEFPAWAVLALLIILIVIGVLFVLLQWPLKKWSYGPHPRLILDKATESTDIQRIKRELAVDLGQTMEQNANRIRLRSRFLQASVVLLVAEVVIFVVGMVSAS